MASDGEWRLVMVNECKLWWMMASDGEWWQVIVNDGKWLWMVASDGEWWLVMVNDGRNDPEMINSQHRSLFNMKEII